MNNKNNKCCRVLQRLGLARLRRQERSSWLLQPSVTKLPTRQALEEFEASEAPLLSGDAAAKLVLRGDRSAGALSHGWLMGGDCDPKAERLALVARTRRLERSSSIFDDVLSARARWKHGQGLNDERLDSGARRLMPSTTTWRIAP